MYPAWKVMGPDWIDLSWALLAKEMLFDPIAPRVKQRKSSVLIILLQSNPRTFSSVFMLRCLTKKEIIFIIWVLPVYIYESDIVDIFIFSSSVIYELF